VQPQNLLKMWGKSLAPQEHLGDVGISRAHRRGMAPPEAPEIASTLEHLGFADALAPISKQLSPNNGAHLSMRIAQESCTS
jgi:hypothetical protein